LTAIILGHLIGTGLLALRGYIFFIRRRSAMESVVFSLEQNDERVAAFCNVIQLTGWTVVIVIQAGSAVTAIFPALSFAPVSLALGLLVLLCGFLAPPLAG
jgi:purine-cytosine permease-like protein